MLAGTMALIALAATVSGLGANNVMVMRVSVDPSLARVGLGTALAKTVLSGAVLIFITTLAGSITLSHVSVVLLISIGVGEIVFVRVVEICAQLFQAHSGLQIYSAIVVMLQVCKLAAALSFSASHWSSSANAWGVFVVVAEAIAVVVALQLAVRRYGTPIFTRQGLTSDLTTGFYFVAGKAGSASTADVDKLMLANLDTTVTTGIYSAGYRIVQTAFTPVLALFTAAYPRYFKAGKGGVSEATRYSKHIGSAAVLLGSTASIALFVLAPVVPKVIGSSYHDTVAAIRWLALLPLLQTVHYLAGDALTGANRQKDRSILQACGLTFNVLLNAALIPAYSWRGACFATLLTELLLAIGMWLRLHGLGKQEQLSSASRQIDCSDDATTSAPFDNKVASSFWSRGS